MSYYITPTSAYRQLNKMYEMGTSVYIYGATGYGKTRLVKEFLEGKDYIWLSVLDVDWDNKIIGNNTHGLSTQCIVIDDAQFIDSKKQINRIVEFIRNNNWVILIGRVPSPQWLVPIISEGTVNVISEKQLKLSASDIIQMAAQYETDLSEETAEIIAESSEGNAFAISTIVQLINQEELPIEEVIKKADSMFANHIEQEVIPQWDMYLQEFLMMVSVVDEFTLPMAVMITGDDQAAKLIEESANLGNFITENGEKYRLRPQLIKALRNRALKIFGLTEYKRYIANAAHYYEMQDDILKALELYEECEKKENIKALLIRNGRRHAGVGHYYELRKYYFELDDEDIEKNPVLMTAVSLLYSILMNPEKSEYWYAKLQEEAKNRKFGEKKEIDELLLYLDLSLPHRGEKGTIDAMKHAFSAMQGGRIKVPELSITNNGPSAMNGGKDFCEWSKKDKLLADTIGKIVEAVTGDMGRGLVHAALCESIFEKGINDAEAIHHSMLLNLDVEGGGKYELMFVSVATQARLGIISGNFPSAIRVIDAFEDHIRNYDNEVMKHNIDAFRCRMDLISGKNEKAEEWLSKAPDELLDFCVLDRYRYMTKAMCYIQFGMNTEAVDILAKLRYYAEEYQRNYIHMETGLLLSIVSRRNDGEWKALFLATLEEIQDYQFVRIISEKGAGIFPLLKEVKKYYLAKKKSDAVWFSRVYKEAELLAKKYPGFLNCSSPQPNDFSEVDVKILRLQADGLSTKEIANQIYMSERTVKYHASENYRKLGASGKVEAIQIAKNINLI